MATQSSTVAHIGPEWNRHQVVTFNGTFDTHIDDGADYDTLTLAQIFTAEPLARGKTESPAFIPSSYCGHDAREHARQRDDGRFVALCGDVDEGDHAPARIESLVRGFCGDSAWLIFSTANARPGNMRWRIIVPLAAPVGFEDWFDAQLAFFAFMESNGVVMDQALARAAQPVYLPNVPEVHSKTGTPLRDESGKALYYKRKTTPLSFPGLSIEEGTVSVHIGMIRRQREADEQQRERLRAEAEERRANRPAMENGAIIEEFNRANSIATLLEVYGYQQSPRNGEDWRSPYQTGETYATRIMDGDKWVSLSGSDVGNRVGQVCRSGCFGDAYDLYVHFEHNGDHKAAFRALHAERRAAAGLPVTPPPPPQSDDPGPQPEDFADPIEPEDAFMASLPAQDAAQAQAEQSDLPIFHPADWQGSHPPTRQWRWADFLPDMQASLVTGAGASGKSLATQQMATCIAMGIPFLGVETKRCPALYITCEDDLDELQRRQTAICESLGITLESTREHLFLLSLQGEIGNELAMFSPDGEMTIAPRFHQIERACLDRGVRHVTIDNTAHTFAGNENDRHQVAAFVNLNNRLAQNIGGSVLMVGHPNKAGDSYSGSTAWENQVRSRLYLEVPKSDEGMPVDPDLRVLRNEKANYSQRGAEVHFYWLKGAFVTEDQMPQGNEKEMRESAQAAYENGLFLKLLDTLTEQKRNISHAPNVGHYGPKIMAGMPEGRGLSRANFARAMERLFAIGEIEASAPLWKGSDRHPVLGIARKGRAGGAAGGEK